MRASQPSEGEASSQSALAIRQPVIARHVSHSGMHVAATPIVNHNPPHEVNGFMRGSVGQVRHSIGGKYFRRGK